MESMRREAEQHVVSSGTGRPPIHCSTKNTTMGCESRHTAGQMCSGHPQSLPCEAQEGCIHFPDVA